MILKPCKGDVYGMAFVQYPFALLLLFLMLYWNNWNWIMAAVSLPILLYVSIGVGKNCLYLMRTIHITSEGLTITIGKYRKTYSWSEMIVYDYKNDTGMRFNEWKKPGLLIIPRHLTKSPLQPPIASCSSHHPLSSVFLRFESNDTTKRDAMRMGVTLEGYTVPKEKILAFLAQNTIPVQKISA